MVAIVLGGADCCYEDLEEAIPLAPSAQIFAVNDQIAHYPGDIIAATLHPAKIRGWLNERERRGFPRPAQVWCHKAGLATTHVSADPLGSVGLFAVKVALKLGHRKIILAGVPMCPSEYHFVRHTRWNAAHAFRNKWKVEQLAPFVRSFSGWTEEQFGRPTREWLDEA